MPYLGEDPSIGIVQTPQFFRYREEQTWVEQGAGVTQEFFYRMVQVCLWNTAACGYQKRWPKNSFIMMILFALRQTRFNR